MRLSDIFVDLETTNFQLADLVEEIGSDLPTLAQFNELKALKERAKELTLKIPNSFGNLSYEQ
jgi:hypothetical protein